MCSTISTWWKPASILPPRSMSAPRPSSRRRSPRSRPTRRCPPRTRNRSSTISTWRCRRRSRRSRTRATSISSSNITTSSAPCSARTSNKVSSKRTPNKKAPEHPPGLFFFERDLRGNAFGVCRVLQQASGARAHPHHEAVEAQFRHLHPGQRFVPERGQACVQLVEVRIAFRKLRIDLVGGGLTALQQLLRERTQLRAGDDQPFQCRRVDVIVLAGDPGKGVARSALDRGLIVFRQRVPLFEVHDIVALAGAFPPARIVVELRHLHEAELLVVVGTDPFRRIAGAFFH